MSVRRARGRSPQELGVTARWNDFGTPRSLIRHDGHLVTGVQGADAEAAARAWLASERELFRLRSTDGLGRVAESRLGDGDGWVVTLAQRFGELRGVEDGLVTVGLAKTGDDWSVAYGS